MKILLQNQYSGALAGAESYLMLLLSDLKAMGHELVCVYTRSGVKADHGIEKDGVTNYYLPYLEAELGDIWSNSDTLEEMKRDVRLLMGIVDRHKPDIFHLNNTFYPFLYASLKDSTSFS